MPGFCRPGHICCLCVFCIERYLLQALSLLYYPFPWINNNNNTSQTLLKWQFPIKAQYLRRVTFLAKFLNLITFIMLDLIHKISRISEWFLVWYHGQGGSSEGGCQLAFYGFTIDHVWEDFFVPYLAFDLKTRFLNSHCAG